MARNADWMTRLGVVEIDEIQRFRFTLRDGTVELLDFVPWEGTPGFSHKVAYNGKLTRKHLSEEFGRHRITQRTALDMLDIVRRAAADGVL